MHHIPAPHDRLHREQRQHRKGGQTEFPVGNRGPREHRQYHIRGERHCQTVCSHLVPSQKRSGFRQRTPAPPSRETRACREPRLRSRPLIGSTLVHRGGFEPPYLLRGTDLQSVGFNHSPTCAKSGNTPDAQNSTPTQHCISQLRETKCGNSRL